MPALAYRFLSLVNWLFVISERLQLLQHSIILIPNDVFLGKYSLTPNIPTK